MQSTGSTCSAAAKNGRNAMLRSSGPNGSVEASWSAMCSSEPCVWTTPFGLPVLPLVSRMHAGSLARGCGSVPVPCGSRSRNGQPASPSRVAGSTSPTIVPTASTCASCARISATSSIALSGTAMQPARSTPRYAAR